MNDPLPPLQDESFDGEKQKTEVSFVRCKHEKVSFKNGMLICPCGSGWSGPNLHELYTLLYKG